MHIHYFSDRGQIETNSPNQSIICSFQTFPNSRGHIFAKVRAIGTDNDMSKAWLLSCRFKRVGDVAPELSTPIYSLVDGDPLASSWNIALTSDASGLISIECFGSNANTLWIAEFDSLETNELEHS